ncbi:E3 ubiquitin-protein ligase RNF135 isoform X2 [Ascaphus truei]|uniref:E3 ubiquitin-protein ligase RNF135 isoform X2 n=1 Tax=Ascaphus truei TaxID=8439 RepID=UPI003F595B36
MAGEQTALLRLRDSDLSCDICMNHYTHPSTLPCGHTFCKDCILQHWQGTSEYNCPMCRETFPTKPRLSKTTVLASLLDSLHAQKDPWAGEPCPSCAGPGALKLCLPCMAPVCQDHLRLHCEDPAQQRHLLVDAPTAAAAWTCRHHEHGLQFYCATHCSPLCPTCVLQHAECRPVPLLELYKGNKTKLKRTIGQVARDITEKEGVVASRKNSYREIQILACEIKENLPKEFRAMKDYLEKQERASLRRIQEEQEQAQKKINENINLLSAEIEKMRDIKTKLEDNIENNWIKVLQDVEIYEPSSASAEEALFNENRIIDVTIAVSEMRKSLLAHPLLEEEPSSPRELKIFGDGPELHEAAACPDPIEAVPETNQKQFLQWARDVSFDECTVSCRLSLSPDFKTVTVTEKKRSYLKNPRRFTGSQVLCCQGFSTGCHYWEISTKDSNGWGAGIASQGIGMDDRLGRNDLSWSLEWIRDRLSAWHGNKELPLCPLRPDTVGVLLDCGEKSLAFFSVTEGMYTLLHSYNIRFEQQVFPAVWLFGIASGNSLTINDI